MAITDVRIYKLKVIDPQKAFVAVTLDDEFAVHGLNSWPEMTVRSG